MKKVAYSPQGFPIRGTLETCRGVAVGAVYVDDAGMVQIEYTGETAMWWEEQHTVMQDEKFVYVDHEGNECTEDQFVWKGEEDGD